MDGEKFDSIVRLMAAAAPRRKMLKVLTGGLLGGVASVLGLEPAKAQTPCAAPGGTVGVVICRRPVAVTP